MRLQKIKMQPQKSKYRIQNSESRIIKELQTAIDAGEPLLGHFSTGVYAISKHVTMRAPDTVPSALFLADMTSRPAPWKAAAYPEKGPGSFFSRAALSQAQPIFRTTSCGCAHNSSPILAFALNRSYAVSS